MSTENKNDKQNQSDEVELLDHDYDGIREYDHPLPNWWLMTFFGTIIFGFIYYIHYTSGAGLTLEQELEVAMKALPQTIEKIWNEEELKGQMGQPEALAQGKAVYTSKCSACHGPEGQGLIGPNLTDQYWIHGKGKRADLMAIVTKGATDKGMPAWAGMISDDEIVQVAGFVYSLKDTKPSNPKAPQGAEVSN